MNLKEHYNLLYNSTIKKLKNNNYSVDTLINSPLDNRFGITLLIRPSATVKNKIQEFISELKVLEPDQYFYPSSDIHITVMSIISCYDGFTLSQINPTEYQSIIKQSLHQKNKFNISFKGITASTSCVMLQGFFNDETLDNIRNSLRTNFKNTTLEQSLDKRYTIQTAHATIFRIQKPLKDKIAFINLLKTYKDFDFGTFTVDSLELVYNDWYQKAEKIQKLYTFPL
ncbi:mutarotase [uncultured Maribacter sp.]|uniref:2'-5' RNA ligase family protein n=1 Tax=uncultured Maribacter sp. TaxID=431308 RepID=UPI00262AF4DF|nr:mutarotase [uncultured Maribacter sp.]